MRAVWAFVLVLLGVFQTLNCQNWPYQNGYNNYPQANGRQVPPNQGVPGQGQQLPVNGNQGNAQMPTNQQFPPQNEQQFPQPVQQNPTQPFAQPGQPNPVQPFPQTGQPNPVQPFPQTGQPNPTQPLPQPGQQIPGQQFPQPGQPGSYPQPPYGMNLTPEGQWAYSYIMQQIAQMLNDPVSRNGMLYLMNSLRTILSNPNSIGVMQEFVNRWMNAVNQPGYGSGLGPNVVVQTVQPSSFLDMIKRKGTAVVNLAKDMAVAKANAFNTIFGDGPLSSFATTGTNMASAGMQGFGGMVSPFLNSPGSGTVNSVTPGMNIFGG